MKAYAIKRPGRPPGDRERARLAAPACEKCRHLAVNGLAISCAREHDEFDAARCPDYDDVSRDRPRMVGGVSGRMVAA